ncbi:MAG: hypothetical protein ACRDSK_02350 [Actinophytocola sp.]|uniref:hypothetical protein n=1 Tax=Actinophytocola sp. TaxID=1872138 RepID=UPI003D6A3131
MTVFRNDTREIELLDIRDPRKPDVLTVFRPRVKVDSRFQAIGPPPVYSADGRLLAVLAGDRTVRLWNIDNPREPAAGTWMWLRWRSGSARSRTRGSPRPSGGSTSRTCRTNRRADDPLTRRPSVHSGWCAAAVPWRTPPPRMDFVNAERRAVKVPSSTYRRPAARSTLASFGRRRGGPVWKGHRPMADLAYAVLLVAGFLILALTLRGLEKL